jgi:CDGSH-type Zn-finger protein
MADNASHKKPQIVFTRYSPYTVVDLDDLRDHRGETLRTAPVFELCRCGQSKHKPYCDGSHVKAGFVGRKEEDRVKDRVIEYRGRHITIYDNRGVCCHDMSCVNLLPSVFDRSRKRWINPDGAGVEEIIETIEKCPSGALSYRIGSRRYQDLDRAPSITVVKDGPLKVEGYIALKDDMGSKPESAEHCTLCRCGAAKNRPFCDGSHADVGFRDPSE